MSKLNNSLYIPKFSHIYIEKKIMEHPLTKKVLARFPQAKMIEINHYKDVFARSKQNFVIQKQTMKLILAQNNDTFLYEGADVSQDFGNEHFYYTSSILNCLYNCEYCFLQGMFPSANLVLFVNIEDYFTRVEELLQKHPVYLCISYESDLLALERVAPFASMWLHFAQQYSQLSIELRTKSINYTAIKHMKPSENIILAWTLSPDSVVQQYEHDTPSLDARLASIKQAIDDGWKVRLSFDPILHIDQWKTHYQELIEKTFAQLPVDQIIDVSIGVFRISKQYLKKMRKENTSSALIHYPYEAINGVYSYPEPLMNELVDYVYECVQAHIPSEHIYSL